MSTKARGPQAELLGQLLEITSAISRQCHPDGSGLLGREELEDALRTRVRGVFDSAGVRPRGDYESFIDLVCDLVTEIASLPESSEHRAESFLAWWAGREIELDAAFDQFEARIGKQTDTGQKQGQARPEDRYRSSARVAIAESLRRFGIE